MIKINNGRYTTDYKKITDCSLFVTAPLMGRDWSFKESGRAVCSPDDEFNLEFGRELSKARALKQAYKRYEKELIRYSYRNNRKKISFTTEAFNFHCAGVHNPRYLQVADKLYELREVKNDKWYCKTRYASK